MRNETQSLILRCAMILIVVASGYSGNVAMTIANAAIFLAMMLGDLHAEFWRIRSLTERVVFLPLDNERTRLLKLLNAVRLYEKEPINQGLMFNKMKDCRDIKAEEA